MALTGSGGLGKSVLLLELAREARERTANLVLQFSGSALRAHAQERLGEGLELGRFLASARGHAIEIFIDSFEDIADTVEERRNYLAEIGKIAEKGRARVVLTARATTWKSVAVSLGQVAGWQEAELAEWNEAIVERLVGASQRPQLPSDVLGLLRTPLLLDLFLRTFGNNDIIPATLHTRHAILSAFWARRVLPPDQQESSVRRRELLRCAREEASGIREHADPNQILLRLAGDGVFLVRGGVFLFRHPLLRDFALAHWAIAPESEAASPAQALMQIQSGLAQWGAMRALIEAAYDALAENQAVATGFPSPTELIRSIDSHAPSLLPILAEVLGELGAPNNVRTEVILDSFASPDAASRFLDRLLSLAQLSTNVCWLRWLSQLPDSTAWFDEIPWARTEFVVRAGLLLDATWKDTPQRNRVDLFPVAQAVARRIREWSMARTVQANPDDLNNRLPLLMPLVARLAPGTRTLEWLASHATRSSSGRMAVMESLPNLASTAQELGQHLDANDVAKLFVSTGGLKWMDNLLITNSEAPNIPIEEYLRTTIALLGQHSNSTRPQGLLELMPETFLPVVFGFLAGLGFQRQKTEWRQKNSSEVVDFKRDGATLTADTTEAGRLEQELNENSPPNLSIEEVMGQLVDDTYDGSIEAGGHERALLLSTLKSRLHEALSNGDVKFAHQFWTSAKTSRSAFSWILLLESLVQERIWEPTLVDELITKRPLYHLFPAQEILHRAISLRWQSAHIEVREDILKRISEIAKSPLLNGLYAVAPILTAIPQASQPEALRVYDKLYHLRGWNPRPQRKQSHHPEWGLDSSDIIGLGKASCTEKEWEDILSRSALSSVHGSDEAAFSQFFGILRLAISRGLPSAVETKTHVDILSILRSVFERIESRRNVSHSRVVTDSKVASVLAPTVDFEREEVEAIATWALGIMCSVDATALNSDLKPVPVDDTPTATTLEPWRSGLWLIDAALVHPGAIDNSCLRAALFEEVQRVTVQPSPSVAWYLFSALRPWHWLRPDDSKASLVWGLLSQKVTDPGVLRVASKNLIPRLSPEQGEQLVRRWLSLDRDPASPDAAKFVVSLGELIGAYSLHRINGERMFWAVLLEELLVASPRTGVLSEPETYAKYVSQLMFGAKRYFLGQPPSSALISDYANMFAACARQFMKALAREHMEHLIIWALEPVLRMASEGKSEYLMEFWSQMNPTVCRIIRDGQWTDAQWTIFRLRDSQLAARLGADTLMGVVEAIAAKHVDLSTHSTHLRENEEIGQSYHYAMEYAVDLAGQLGTLGTTTSQVKNRLFAILQSWAGSGLHSALVAARNIRTR
ncbi:hypothetical protein [Myxococcus stipitatus]|uniref:hypothetical protein n=1 Tax=Myxococcus stipitatus TaxID=83455 RepID=UPI0030CBA0F2